MTADLRAAAQKALVALEYHTQQTRPIEQTEHAIKALMEVLAAPSPVVKDSLTTQAPAEAHGDEREQFDGWWKAPRHTIEESIAWNAWQARAALASKVQPKGTANQVVWTDAAILSLMNRVGDGPFGEEDVAVTRLFMRHAEEIRPELAAAQAPAPEHPTMADEMRAFIEGMSVSVDVSTCDDDADRRYFGTVTEVMDAPNDKHGVTLLVQDAEPNFTVPCAAVGATSLAAQDVLAERQRQINAEGWTPEHDDEHSAGELARAAACYADPDLPYVLQGLVGFGWPWAAEWWKPSSQRRNLVKAGALILAEIERLDRASHVPVQGSEP